MGSNVCPVDLGASGESLLFNLQMKVPHMTGSMWAARHLLMVLEHMSCWHMTQSLNCLPPDVTNNAAIQKQREMLPAGLRSDFLKLKTLFMFPPEYSKQRRYNTLCLAGEAEETKPTLCVISLKPNYNIYPCLVT